MEWWQIVLLILGSIVIGILAGALVTYLIGRFTKKPVEIPLAGAKIGEELEAKVIAKREAEEAKAIAKREAEEAKQRAKQLIEEARDRTKQESEESARIMAEEKQEAEQANKESEEGTKEELEYGVEAVAPLFVAEDKSEVVEPMAEVEASVAPTQGDSPRLFEGMLELEITVSDADQISYLISHLRQVSFLQIMSLSGSTNGERTITVSIIRPLPLLSILREMPQVDASMKGDKIQVVLKTTNGDTIASD